MGPYPLYQYISVNWTAVTAVTAFNVSAVGSAKLNTRNFRSTPYQCALSDHIKKALLPH